MNKIIFLLSIFIITYPLNCQINKSAVSTSYRIPFIYENNKVLVPVMIGNSRTLNLILDSGFGYDGIIIFAYDLTDSVELVNRIIVQVPGAGKDAPSQGIMSDSMTFKSGDCKFENQRIIFLNNENFRKKNTDGVIGYSLFGYYKVEIDYDEKIITLHDNSEVLDETGWDKIPLTFNKENWPFLDIKVSVEDEEPVLLNVYIDYASSLSLEFTEKTEKKIKPPKTFESDFYGFGLSGEIHGKTGRVSKFIIGKYEFNNVTATFFGKEGRSKSDKSADGVISNDALRRFNLIFDYKNKKLLIKPNKSFNEPFEILN